MNKKSTQVYLVVYDGDCGICEKFMRMVLKLDSRGLFRFLPFQDKDVLQNNPMLTLESCKEEVKLIQPDGRILGGADAVISIVRNLPTLFIVGFLFSLFPFRHIARWVYPKIAKNRKRFSSTCGLNKPHDV